MKKDPWIKANLESSHLYMIATREEATFVEESFAPDEEGPGIRFTITTGGNLTDEIKLDLRTLAENVFGVGNDPSPVKVRGGKKWIQLFADFPDEDIDSGRVLPFEVFTPEKLIFDFGRRKPGINGFLRHREFATYTLLYVGIAKESNTYKRLLEGPHHKRLTILGNAYPVRSNARVTDELILFAWAADPVIVKSIQDPDDIDKILEQEWNTHYKAVIADAEKAFVHVLDPDYNDVKFKKYPEGDDGLYGHGYGFHSFTLAENYTFVGRSASMYGAQLVDNVPHADADVIITKGDTVTLVNHDSGH